MQLLERAAANRWDIPDNVREIATMTLGQILANPSSTTRDKIAAARALTAMEGQNQADDHKKKPDRNVSLNISAEDLNNMSEDELNALERRCFGDD